MSRFKRLRNKPSDPADMTVEQLRAELAYYQGRARVAAHIGRGQKEAMKQVHRFEQALRRKLAQ